MLKAIKKNNQIRISSSPTIGIDLLSCSSGPLSLMQATLDLSSHYKDLHFCFIGTPDLERDFIHKSSERLSSTSLHIVEEMITMEENPLMAIRRKKNSSLFQGIHLLKEKKIDAFVTAGNTGALMACANMLLPPLPSIHRPALLALIPSKKNLISVIDIGANVTRTEKLLVECAHLGAALQKTRGITFPRVGLLNIGEEAKKGTTELKKAYQTLEKLSARTPAPFEFIGNVEAKMVFEGDVDVLVTDGFTGNIFLKTSEGIANLILDRLRVHVSQNEFASLRPLLSDLEKQLHYAQYPGAILCGIDGTIVKCHGYSTPAAFSKGIEGTIQLLRSGYINSMKLEMGNQILLSR
jgi:phosphate acyltransferase